MTTGPCDCVRLREQVRVMREALERIIEIGDSQFGYYYVDIAKQALKNLDQYSLGDGGKGE